MSENNIIKVSDAETGEEFEFVLADGFEYKDRKFYVLVPAEEDGEDEVEFIIMEEVADEGGELMLESISEEEEDEIYDYYDELYDEAMDDLLDDEDESEEE